MLDLMELGNRLWESSAAEMAEKAEKQQPRGLEPETEWRKSGG